MLRSWFLFFIECLSFVVVVFATAYLWIEPHLKESFVEVIEQRVGLEAEVDEFFFSPTGKVEGKGLVFRGIHPELGELTFNAGSYSVNPQDNIYEYLWNQQDKFRWLDLSYDVTLHDITISGYHPWLQVINLDELNVILEPKGMKVSFEALSWEGIEGQARLENLQIVLDRNQAKIQLERLTASSKTQKAELGGMALELLLPKDRKGLVPDNVNIEEWITYIEDWRSSSIHFKNQQHDAQIEALRMLKLSDATWNLNAAVKYNEESAKIDNRIELLVNKNWALKGKYELEEYNRIFDYSLEGPLKLNGPWTLSLDDRQKNHLEIDLTRNEEQDWIGTINLDLDALKIPKVEGPVISGKLKGGLKINEQQDLIKLTLNGNDLAGGPNMTREGELSLQLDWDRKENYLELVHLIAGEKDKWSAKAKGGVITEGWTPDRLDVVVDRFPLGKYSARTAGDVSVSANLVNQVLSVRVFSDRLMPNKDPLKAMDKFEVLIYNDREKVDFKLSNFQRGMLNQIALKADVKDLLKMPENLKAGQLKFFQVKTDIFDLQLQKEVPVAINLHGLKVDHFHLDDQEERLRNLKGKAYIPFFKQSLVDMQAEGVLDLAFMPQVASTEAKGVVKVMDANWQGSFSLRNLKAKLSGKGIDLKPQDILPELRVQSIEGRLEDSKVFIDDLKGKTKDGKMNVSGFYDFVNRSVEFDIAASDINYSHEDYDIRYNVDQLSVEGDTLDLNISGNLIINDFLYNRDISLNSEETLFRKIIMKPPEALDVRHKLDLRLVTPEPLTINNNVARLSFISNGLRVYGPLAKPKWVGDITTVKDSKNRVTLPIQFLDVSMKAEKVNLKFQDQDEWNPQVVLDAETEVDDVDIFLKYDGKMDDVYNGNYQLSSIPAYNRQEILALLGTGDRPNQAPFEDKSATKQKDESPSITLLKSNKTPLAPIPITYQASVSSGETPFEFRVDYKLNEFLGLELSQAADEEAFAGIRFSKNMSSWGELFKFKSEEKKIEEDKTPIKWKLSGAPGMGLGIFPHPLKTQLRKMVNPSLHEGEYDIARQRIEKIMNAFLMERGYRDATYVVKEISKSKKIISRRNGEITNSRDEILVDIEIEPGRYYSLHQVEIVGVPEEVELVHPWLKPSHKRLRLLKMREVEVFKQSLLRKLADNGYPAAEIETLEVVPIKVDEPLEVSEEYQKVVIAQGRYDSHRVRGSIAQSIKIVVNPGEKHQVVQLLIEGLSVIDEEKAREVIGFENRSYYSERNLEHYQQKLLDWYLKEGYFGTQVILDQALRSRSYPRVSLHFEVTEGRRWKCGQVYFKGLKEIDPDYLYRNFKLKPGEWMTPEKVQKAFTEFGQSEIVRAVEHKWLDTDDPEIRDLEISIQEIDKLRVAMRIGYESGEGLQYALRVKEYHLWGLGRSLAYESNLSAKEQLHLIKYEIPDLPFEDWRSQFILAKEVNRLSRLEFKNTTNLFGVSLGTQDQRRKINHDVFFQEDRNFEGQEPSLRYRFSFSKSHAELPEQPGKGFGYRIKSTMTNYLERDGLYYFGDYRASYGFKFGGSILTPWTRLGHSQEIEANFDVPFADRYFLGGAKSLRGFAEDEISGMNGQGGESLWSGGLELFYPVHKWMDGSVFYEMGRLYHGNLETPLRELSHSIGLGLLIRTPVGPIQGYFAHPLNEDRIGRLGLQLGTIF